MSKDRIWLSSPHLGNEEEVFVKEVFESNWIAPLGPAVDGFEKDLQDYNKINHIAALSSGTAAVHLALILSSVQANDLVLCQSLTFCGSSHPILYLKANAVFIDSEMETWNMDPNCLEDALKRIDAKGDIAKVKAIIPVHLYGMPAHIEAIIEVASKYDLRVIEDAAEALGSSINGKKCGAFGHFGIFSFNGNKIITTSGGGALASNNKAHIEKSRFLSTQARDAAPHYEHSEIGYNYRLSNVLAGIGRGQMKVLPQRVEQKRQVFEFYKRLFKNVAGVSYAEEPEGYYSNRWLSAIYINPQQAGFSREHLRLALAEDNIESRPIWKPMHRQKVYNGSSFYGTGIAEKLFENGLCLPSGTNLSKEQFERIEQKINKFLQR